MRRIGMVAALVLLASGAAVAKEQARTLDMTGKKERAMANCPSAVTGADTRVQNRADGVELTVVASDPQARQEIQRRAHRQQTVSLHGERGALEHTGEGTGSGRFGFCPGMAQDSRVAVDELPNGARLTVRPNTPSHVGKLQKETADRLKKLHEEQR